jgi:hypothetical protein
MVAAAIGAALVNLAGAARAEDMAVCQDSYVAGQRRYKLEHDFLGAREQLLLCAKTCPDELRVSCGQWLTEIGRELPSIVVKAKDGGGHDVLDATIEVDGKAASGALDGTPIDLNPGEHTIRVLRPRRPAAQETVVLHPGERLRVVEVWTEAREAISVPMRRPIPLAAFILAGVSAASLASFGVFAAWSTVEFDRTSTCTPSCPPSGRDASFTTKTVIADASLGVAAASLMAAGVVYLVRPAVPVGTPRLGFVAPWVTPRGGGLGWSAVF